MSKDRERLLNEPYEFVMKELVGHMFNLMPLYFAHATP
jgi:hypothetical protein